MAELMQKCTIWEKIYIPDDKVDLVKDLFKSGRITSADSFFNDDEVVELVYGGTNESPCEEFMLDTQIALTGEGTVEIDGYPIEVRETKKD